MRPVLALLPAILLLAAPAAAQQPAPDPAASVAQVVAGTYHVEPEHTQITFAVEHMGFTIFRGVLSKSSGTLELDPKNPAAAKLSVTVPISSIRTTSDKLNEELVAPDWFDAAKFPTASFVSTKITLGNENTALVEGNLTLHGVTKPVKLLAHFHGAGPNPLSKAATVGFDGRLTINRSEFGITKYVPLISDWVEMDIAAAFEK